MGMTKPDIDALIKALGVQERVLLFCLASGTDWKQAGVTFKTAVDILVMGRRSGLPLVHLVKMHRPGGRLALTGGRLELTDAGRAALRALLRDL
jgi:hypothetical protein